MTRRELLRRGALALAAPAWFPRGAAGQGTPQPPPPPQPAGGDRLYNPSLVQERSAATAADNDPAIKALEQRLKCTCGCNLDIYTCRTTDFTCTYSPELHREVLALRQAGKSPDEIVAAFVAKHGEQILMAPKAEGFNLAGYLLPGAAVLLAGGLLAVVLLRRSRAQAALPGEPAAAGPAPADEARLQRALAEVED